MRVLIDCTQVTRKKAGVGVYAENMIREMIALDSGMSWFLLVQDDDPDFDFSRRNNVRLIRVSGRIFRKLPFRFLLEQLFIPFLALVYHIHVIHSLLPVSSDVLQKGRDNPRHDDVSHAGYASGFKGPLFPILYRRSRSQGGRVELRLAICAK
jgi:hypothetical protein